ncbi:MAG: tetratricopeptide repeat protein [Cryomorphaceae bacterium]|nr:tetratricopeptide repeat protein [Cryomorphaceae bacterium]
MQYRLNQITLLFVLFFGMMGIVELKAQKLDSDSLYVLARIAGNDNQNFALAAHYCEQALEQSPLNMDIKEFLGKCYMELGQFVKARITLLEVLQQSPARVDARHYLLNIETQDERYSSALCYANELLQFTPYAKTLWIKKIFLFRKMENEIEANRLIKRLYQVFPNDEDARRLYRDLMMEEAREMSQERDLMAAAKHYEAAIAVNNEDPELYLSLINTYEKLGNYDEAGKVAEMGSYYLPENKEIFKKRVGILEEQRQYGQAIELVKDRNEKYPSQENRDLLRYLKSQAARYQRSTEAYELYGQVYDSDPSNQEAFDYLLNTALARGYYGNAQELLSQALKSSPNNKQLLVKQLYLHELRNDRQGQRSTLEKLYTLYPNDTDIQYKRQKFEFEDARDQFQNKNYKPAIATFETLKNHEDYGYYSKQYLISIYLDQEEYAKAERLIEDLQRQYPEDERNVVRQVDLYMQMGDYERAYDLANLTYQRNPDNKEYEILYSDVSVMYLKYLIEKEHYELAKRIGYDLIMRDQKNELGYIYTINALLSMRQYNEAVAVINDALLQFPEARDFKLKLAGVLADADETDEAVAILKELKNDYPYNSLIRDSYIDQLFVKASKHEKEEEYLEAADIYVEILEIKPSDTLAAIKYANILIMEERYEDAMNIIDNALLYRKGHNELIFKKGVIYELQEEYELALQYYQMYIPDCHEIHIHRDRINNLKAKLLKNEFSIGYLRAVSDSTLFFMTNVATAEYVRYEDRNTYVARVNYAGRRTGVGWQGEVDWYHTFRNKTELFASAGIANQFFPRYKLMAMITQPIDKDWSAEIGARYFRLFDGRNLYALMAGLERRYERVVLNARGAIFYDGQFLYNNLQVQGNFFMENGRDRMFAMASFGTVPEFSQLDFQINTFLTFVNTMVGGGYVHHFNYRNKLTIMGNWYNFRVTETSYVNQYMLYLQLTTNF